MDIRHLCMGTIKDYRKIFNNISNDYISNPKLYISI